LLPTGDRQIFLTPSYLPEQHMGYSTKLYAIDLDELKSFYGSNDGQQLAAVLQQASEEIESIDGFFSDRIDDCDDDWPMAEDAMAEICAAKCVFDNAAEVYGYCLECICQVLGERIAYLAPLTAHPYRSALLDERVPIPIPRNSDFPTIAYIEAADLPGELNLVRSAVRPDDECLAEDIDEYQAALEQTIANGKSIIAFYY
jgi:hypothetical protein